MTNAPYSTGCFPLHLALLSCGENFHPMGCWTVVGKEPFRFLISVGLGTYTRKLLREYKEAALHRFPWSARAGVVRAGCISGRDGSKTQCLKVILLDAEKFRITKLVDGFENAYECEVFTELNGISVDHAKFVLDVVAAREKNPAEKRDPILFFSQQNFINLHGEQWSFRR